MPLNPGKKLGPYEIVARIGAGGMGEVYKARDERLAREVAVKVLPASFTSDPERMRRFEQEARATGQLNHPNILAVYDTGTHDGLPYVVEELLEGETLRDKTDGAPLPARKAIDYARQIAHGLAAAHAKGVVHRDLKPANLFVTHDGRVKILDFGLAKLTRPGEVGSALTSAPTAVETGAGVVLGTVGYMAPEQVRGQPADHRSDIFSFGTILYELLTGRRAFHGDSSIETMNAILKEEPPEPSRLIRELPPGLDRIVEHCLEKSPEERFQSASDLAFQLEALSGISASSAPADALGPLAAPARRAPRRRAMLAVAAGIGVLLAAYLVGLRTHAPAGRPTYGQLTFRQGSIFSGRFAPDSQTVVYGAAWDSAPVELFSARPGSPESRSLGLHGAEILSMSSTGEMAILIDSYYTIGWMRSGTLARVPLAGGVPRPVLENVQHADWDPEGRSLAVARAGGGRYRLEYPIGKVIFETKGWLNSPRFSRDGRWIAFLHHPAIGDNRGLVVVVDREGQSRDLTAPFSSSTGLAWSPAGDEVWFTAGKTGNVTALYAVDLEGNERLVDGAPASLTVLDVAPGGEVLLARNDARRGIIGLAPGATEEEDLSWLDWSRPSDLSDDGQWLLFEEQGQGGGPEYSVYMRRTDGSPAVRLGEGVSQAISPDGRWVMAIPIGRTSHLSILPRGTGTARTVELPGFDLSSARWLPDGKRILLSANENERPMRVYVMDTENDAPRPVTEEGIEFPVVVAPGGEMFAATSPQGVPMLFPVDGEAPRPIPGVEEGDRVVAWSGDGSYLFAARRAGVPKRIYRIDLRTGKRILWKELMPADRAGLLDIGFVDFSGDGLAYAYSYRRFLSTLYLVKGLR